MDKKTSVKDVMSKGDQNATVNEEDTLRTAIVEMNNKQLGVTNVVDDAGIMKGIITDGDLRRLLLRTQDTLPELFNRRCREIMIKNPNTIKSSTSLDEALKVLEDLNVWVIPVVDEGLCVGTVHLHRLLKKNYKL